MFTPELFPRTRGVSLPSRQCAQAPEAIAQPLPRLRLTYAITPPNRSTPLERRRAIAEAQSRRISSLPIDALLVYDVQDEGERNGAPRPFAFAPKLDPLSYAFDHLSVGALPRIVYRAVAKSGEQPFERWLERLHARGGLAVLVGAPSRHSAAPLTLPEAYSLCRTQTPDLAFGGVVIPERHEAAGEEDARVWTKLREGCRFFVSQTVWSPAATKRLLRDLRERAERERIDVPPILLTLSPCGSAQTLEFLEWLGVELPPNLKRELLASTDMLAHSVDLATEIFAEQSAFAADLGFEVGCNVESVSSRPAEVDASLELLDRVRGLLSRRTRLASPVAGDTLP